MIEQPLLFFPSDLLPVFLGLCGVLMVVLRGGVSRVFFDIVGTFQANRLIHDSEAAALAMQALFVDAFSGIAEAAGAINEQIEEMEQNLIPVSREVERARLEFEKFFDETVRASGQLGEVKSDVISLGKDFGFAADEALKAGSRVAQLSAMLGPEVVEPLTRGGLALGAIGEMGAADAQKDFMSLMQQNALILGEVSQEEFNLMSAMEQRSVVTRNVADTLNTLNSVEDRSVARMPEIIEAMNHFGGVARLAGEDIAFMSAMTATLIERGITAESTGMALRFVYARLSGNISGAADELRSLGVETTNADGTLRSLQDILADLSPVYNQLEDSQKPVLAQAMAGNRHFSRLMLLLEDMDRVNELFVEGQQQTAAVLTETGEATGFLATMFEDTAFSITQAEAEIENLRASIGERMLPATLAATEAQRDMLDAFDQISQAFEGKPLGGFVSDLIETRQILSTVFMPYATALLNIQALQIAMGTFHIVLRAVQGEQIAGIKTAVTNQDVLLAKNRVDVMQQRVKNQLGRIRIIRNEQEIMQMERMVHKNRQLVLQAEKRHNIQMKTALNLEKKNATKTREKQIEKELKLLAKERVAIGNQLNVETHEQKVILDQIKLVTQDLLSKNHGLAVAQGKVNAAMKEYLNQQKIAIGQQAQISHAVDTTAHQMSKMAMAGNAVSMIAMVASGAVMTFGESLNAIPFVNFESGADAMMASMLLMGLSFVPLIANIVMTSGALAINAGAFVVSKLATIGATIAQIKFAATSGVLTTALGFLALAFKKETYLKLASLAASGAAAVGQAALAIATGASTVSMNAFAAATGRAVVAMTGLAVLTAAGIALVILASAAMAGMKKMMGFSDATEEATANAEEFSNIDYSTANIDTSMFDNYADSLNNAQEAQESFKNSREELFFGFKAGNVQGALVKQIQQQGVETFIANTEIVQTNNFNGMTTADMANTVLNAIEKEAGARGYNLSNLSI
jgi:TP901 family phage tail tape measure protein